MTNSIKIAIYARVSTARQEEEQTIQSQILQLHDEAKTKNYHIVKEYCDDGWSGDSLERPALDQLRTDAKGKSFEAVLIYDPDRLARRYSYQELLMDELKESGINILFITVAAPVNSEDKILYGVRGLFAEYERAKIKERFRIGKLRKIREGHILTTRPLYGYNYVKKDGQTHGYYTVNEHEANIIRMIFNWVAEDELTIRAVIRKLHGLGIKPRTSARGVWNTSTLSRLLRHKGYIGLAYYGRTYAVVPDNPLKKDKYRKYKKSSTRIRPESEWLTIPIPAIIDKTVFEKAARQMDRNFEFSKRNKKFNYLLSHKAWCACGHRRSASGGTNKYRYYSCNSSVQSFPLPKTCKEKGVNSVAVDDSVWNHLTLLMTSPKLISDQAHRFLKESESKSASGNIELDILQEELKKIKKQEKRYGLAYANDAISVEQLKQFLSSLRDRRTVVETSMGVVKSQAASDSDKFPKVSDIEKFTSRAKKTLMNLDFNAKRNIVLKVVDRVIITSNQLAVFGHIPMDDDFELRSNGRNGVNTIQPCKAPISIPFEINITNLFN